MPNTPLLVQAGVTGISTSENCTDADDELAPIELPDLDGDDDEDPIAALDRLAELELPESDGKA